MEIITSIAAMKEMAKDARSGRQRIGFVPTMGWLHEGHMSLVRMAREQSDMVVVSIFVNPTQFGPDDDFERYPRDLERDAGLAGEEGCDILFVPEKGEMYPDGYDTYVTVERLSTPLCGNRRPGHFRGVATVVAKLFNIVQPHLAFFGQKDAQQCVVIRRMVADLNMDVKLVIGPTVREEDGLAISSRNIYLSAEERGQATVLYRSIKKAEEMIHSGEREAAAITGAVREMIEREPAAELEYVSIVDSGSLEEVRDLEGEVLIALAVRFGRARLIDNTIVRIHNGKGID